MIQIDHKMTDKQLYSLKEISQHLGVHPKTIRYRFKAHKDLFIKNKKKFLYNIQECEFICSLFSVKWIKEDKRDPN